MKLRLLILILGTAYSALSFSQGTWTPKTSFPAGGKNYPFCFSIGDMGYMGTGTDTLAFLTKMDFWEYNTTSDTWTQKASFGGGIRWKAVGFAIGDFGYAGAGDSMVMSSNHKKDLWRYDPSGNSWTRKADMPVVTAGAASFVVNGLAYVATATQNLFEYNPVTDSWATKTNFIASARTGFSAFSISDKGYVGLGTDTGGMRRDFYEYSPATDSWKRIADFIGGGRTGAAAFTLGCEGYIATGDSSKGLNNFYYSDLWEYDPSADAWTQQAYFPGNIRAGAISWSIADKGYVGLGLYLDFYADLYQYTPDTLCLSTGLTSANDYLPFSVYPNPAGKSLVISHCSLEKGEVHVFNVNGEVVLQSEITNIKSEINVSSLAKGIYFVNIANGDRIYRGKFVKE